MNKKISLYSKYKNGKKRYTNYANNNPEIWNILKIHLPNLKNNENLLKRNGEGIDRKDLENILRNEIGQNIQLPTGIRALFHLFGLFFL